MRKVNTSIASPCPQTKRTMPKKPNGESVTFETLALLGVSLSSARKLGWRLDFDKCTAARTEEGRQMKWSR